MKKFFLLAIILLMAIFNVSYAANFSDVPENHWAYDAVSKMVENGVVSGYPDGTFGPDKMVTRAEFAKIVVSTLKLDMTDSDLVQKFDDVGRDHWAFKYVNVASDFLTGYKEKGKTLFLPEVASVREDIAVAIVIASKMNYYTYNQNSLNDFSDVEEISKNLRKYVAIALENDLIHGYEDGTFRPQANLTRAQVCQLMVNLLNVREKVVMAEQNNDNKAKLPNFVYDETTGTVDLGENWRNYVYTFGDSKRSGGWTYTPSQQVLTVGGKINIYGDKYADSSTFFGKYLYIMDRNDKWDNYKLLTITDPFKAVNTEFEDGKIDLGKDYKNFLYSFSFTRFGYDSGTIYEPSQRRLIEDYQGAKLQKGSTGYDKYNGFPLFEGIFVKVMLKANQNASIIIDLPSRETIAAYENQLPEFYFDSQTGTVDLGENWSNYLYSFSDSKRTSGWTYRPSQRVLTIGAHKDKNGNKYVDDDSRFFFGKYLYIMDKNDKWNNVQTLNISDPFAAVNTDWENGKIDLGKDYNKFIYSYTFISAGYNAGTVYTPSQRTLVAEGFEDSNTYNKNGFNSFCMGEGLFVKVMLKSNNDAAFIIDTPNKPETYFSDIVYDFKNLKLDLGANWDKYQYTRYDKVSPTYYPAQRTLNYRGGGNPATNISNSFDLFNGDSSMKLKVMLKDKHSQYKIIDVKNPMYTKLSKASYKDGFVYADFDVLLANKIQEIVFYVDGKAVYTNSDAEYDNLSGTESFKVPNLSEGKHHVYMRVKDFKGNEGISYSQEFTVGEYKPLSVTHNIPSTIKYDASTYKVTFSRALYENENKYIDVFIGNKGVAIPLASESSTGVQIKAKDIFDIITKRQSHFGNVDLSNCDARIEIMIDDGSNVLIDENIKVKLVKKEDVKVVSITPKTFSSSDNITITLNRELDSDEKLTIYYQYSPKGGGVSISGTTINGKTVTIPASRIISTYNASKANAGAIQDNQGIYTLRPELQTKNTSRVLGTFELTISK